MTSGSRGSTASKRTDNGTGRKYVLSPIEKESLWRIYDSADADLHRKVSQAVVSRLAKQAGVQARDELLPKVCQRVEQAVEGIWLEFARRVLRGGVIASEPRRLAEIPEPEIEPYLTLCRAHLLKRAMSECERGVLRARTKGRRRKKDSLIAVFGSE